MTVAEVLSTTDAIKPNGYGQKQKMKWLEYLEGQIYEEIIQQHENPEGLAFWPFGQDEDDMGRRLIVPAPYDEIYSLYLQSRIDLANQEVAKYNNSKTLYNAAYVGFQEFWKRTHAPLQRATHFRF